MVSTRDTSKHWIAASMTRRARRTAMALSAMTLAVTLAFVGTLFEVGRNPATPQVTRGTIALAQDVSATSQRTTTYGDTELIIDDDVPLAASPMRQSSLPTALFLGLVFATTGGFFALRIHQVDANISSMHRTVC